MEEKKVLVKPGDVMFFQRAKTAPLTGAPEYKLEGYAFGLVLGYVPPGVTPPKEENLIPLFGRLGFLRFDDVIEFLGPEIGKTVVDKFIKKYYPKPAEERAKSNLVSLSGQPLERN